MWLGNPHTDIARRGGTQIFIQPGQRDITRAFPLAQCAKRRFVPAAIINEIDVVGATRRVTQRSNAPLREPGPLVRY